MANRHDIPPLPAPLITEASDEELRVRLPEGPQATFSLLWIPVLTRRTLPEVLEAANQQSSWPLFISYRESSAEAREALHAAGISFAGGDGRAFVRAPGILIERHQRPNLVVHDELHAFVDASVRNPFAKRNSRIPRWLLLHHDKPFFVGELAREVDLSSTTASRVLRGLEDAAFVRDTDSDFTGHLLANRPDQDVGGLHGPAKHRRSGESADRPAGCLACDRVAERAQRLPSVAGADVPAALCDAPALPHGQPCIEQRTRSLEADGSAAPSEVGVRVAHERCVLESSEDAGGGCRAEVDLSRELSHKEGLVVVE